VRKLISLGFVLALTLVAIPGPTLASWGPVEAVVGGSYDYLEPDPLDGDVAYVLGQQGVYCTVDGGDSWAEVTPAGEGFIRALQVNRSGTVYVLGAERVYRSESRGLEWDELSFPLAGLLAPRGMAVDPSGQALALWFEGSTMLLSGDGGETWREVEPGEGLEVEAAAISPWDAGTLLLLAKEGYERRLMRSSDGGETWEELAALPSDRSLAVGGPVFLFDPHRQDRFWLRLSDTTFEVLDGGLTVREVDSYVIYDLATSSPTSHRLMGISSDGSMWAVSPDGGESWLTWPREDHRLPLAVRYAGRAGWLYASLPGRGLVRSDDGGRTWQSVNRGLPLPEMAYVYANPPRIYAGTKGVPANFQISDDGGLTWRVPANAGIEDVVFEKVIEGPDGRIYGLPRLGSPWVSADGGESWEMVFPNLVAHLNHDMAFLPGDARTIFLATDRGLYYSRNAGLGWALSDHELLGSGPVLDLAVHRSRQLSVLALVLSPDGGEFLLSSDDGGRTWSTGRLPVGLGARELELCGDDVLVAADRGLWGTSDRGVSWELLLEPAVREGRLLSTSIGFRSVVCADGAIYAAFASSELGIMVSEDGGRSWTAFAAPLWAEDMHAADGELWVASARGLWTTAPTEAPPAPERPRTLVLTLDRREALLDGEPIALDAAPFMQQGRTMVPIRVIGDFLGADLDWDGATRRVTFRLAGKEVLLTVDKTTALVDGRAVTLDAPPVIVGSRAFVPVRFVSEELRANVLWDGKRRTVTVTKEGAPASQ